MGETEIILYYFILATVTFFIVLPCFIVELRVKAIFNQLFPFVLVVLGIVMFYCIGYFVGLKLDSLCPPSFPNSSKDIGFAGLSIFAIGGSFLTSNITQYLKSLSEIENLPNYFFKAYLITDFVSWAIIFGIAVSFITVVFILETLPILTGFISVLILLMLLLLLYIFIIFILKPQVMDFNSVLNRVFFDIDKDPTIYEKYYYSGFFRSFISKIFSKDFEPSAAENESIQKHQKIMNSFATPYDGKIGKYKKQMNFKLFQLYLNDLSKILVSIIDNKKDVYWIDNQILSIIDTEIKIIVNTFHFYLQMHAYSYLLGSLLSQFDNINDLIFNINKTKNFDKPIFKLIDYIDFHSSISIKQNYEHKRLYILTYQLALLEVLSSHISANYCNYLFSESADYSDKFKETMEYSRYILEHFFSHFPSELKDNVAVIVYLIGMYALLMNSTQFRSWDVSIHENWKDKIKGDIIVRYLNLDVINKGITLIIEDLDKSLDVIDPYLFNSLYNWGFDKNQDSSFKFIAGLLVIIDKKRNQNEDFKKLTQYAMRNLTFSDEQITSAINKTLKVDDNGKQIFWEYSPEMIKVLNEYKSKNV
jgi:hypothetical protein